jgi:hypothetical protein
LIHELVTTILLKHRKNTAFKFATLKKISLKQKQNYTSPEMKVVASSHNEQTTTVTSESWIPANISGKNYSIFCSV